MRAYRLEFLQPDDRWTGPYCAEYMTREAFDLRDAMNKAHMSPGHKLSRSFPDSKIFTQNPGKDRLVCASPSKSGLYEWFEGYMGEFLMHGGHIGVYEFPEEELVWRDDRQIVYRQRAAKLVRREGKPVDFSLLQERFHPTKFPKAEIVEGEVWTGKTTGKHFWNILDTDSGRIHIDFTWQQFPAGSKVVKYWIRDRGTLGDGQNTIRRVLLLQSRAAEYLKRSNKK